MKGFVALKPPPTLLSAQYPPHSLFQQVFIELCYPPDIALGIKDEQDIYGPCLHRAHSLVGKTNIKI